MKEIKLDTGKFAKIDDKDYDYIMELSTNWIEDENGAYCIINNEILHMHEAIFNKMKHEDEANIHHYKFYCKADEKYDFFASISTNDWKSVTCPECLKFRKKKRK